MPNDQQSATLPPPAQPHGARATSAPFAQRLSYALIGLLVLGAAYLITVRGEAILVDLASLGSRIWCF